MTVEHFNRPIETPRGRPNQFGVLGNPPSAEAKASDGSPRALADQIAANIVTARAEQQQLRTMMDKATGNWRRIPNITHGAEAISGGAAAASTVPRLVAGVGSFLLGDSKPLEATFQNADKAGRRMTGELSAQTKAANQEYGKLQQMYSAHADLVNKLEGLRNDVSVEGMKERGKVMNQLEQSALSFRDAVAQFNKTADRVIAAHQQFDSDSKHAAAHIAFTAATAGAGAGLHPSVTFVDGAAHIVGEGVLSNIAEEHLEH